MAKRSDLWSAVATLFLCYCLSVLGLGEGDHMVLILLLSEFNLSFKEFCDLDLTILGKGALSLTLKEFVEKSGGFLFAFSLDLVLLLVFEDIPLG